MGWVLQGLHLTYNKGYKKVKLGIDSQVVVKSLTYKTIECVVGLTCNLAY